MTLLVPFDGTPLSEAALVRATQFGAAFDEPVVAATVIPVGNSGYARERGWLDPSEPFTLDTIRSKLEDQVAELAPGASFEPMTVDQYASPGVISKRLRKLAKSRDAVMVFLGSENAGRIVAGLSSVGAGVATDTGYDVVIVRQTDPKKLTTSGRSV